MKFRWKLLILLLVISLVPMFFLKSNGTRVMKEVTTNIVNETRAALTRDAEALLRLYVSDTAAMLGNRGEVLEVAMYFLTHAAANAIEKEEGPSVFAAMPSIHDFREDVLEVPLETHARYYRMRPSGKRVNLEVSFAYPSLKYSATAEVEDKERIAAKMARFRGIFAQMEQATRSWTLWAIITLNDGTMLTYPGTGAFPDDFDPRRTEWYHAAVTGSGNWSVPYFDPATRRPVMAFSNIIFSEAGKQLGVATFVLPLDSLLDQEGIRSDIAPNSEFFLVHPDPVHFRKTGKWKLRILAGQELNESRSRNWRTPIRKEWLKSDTPERMRPLIETLLQKRNGMFRLPYKGRDSLWVVGQLSKEAKEVALIGIAPFERILAPALAAENWVRQTVDSQFQVVRGAFLVVLLFVVSAALIFSRSVTQPLEKLSAGARRLARGDFAVRIRIRSRDEFGDMGRLFNAIVPRLEENLHVRQAMELAREVQQNLLPEGPPDIEGLDVAASSLYSEATGGDYVDYICGGGPCGRRLCVLVGDVSGHGVAAALLMTTARALIRQRAALPGEVDEIVTDVNRELTKDVYKTGRFMTLFYLDVDPQTRNAKWVRAGHDPVAVYNPASDTFRELTGQGLPLGVIEDFTYQRMETVLAPGEIVIIGTDGIWEARNGHDVMYGKQRFLELVRTHHKESAADIVARVIDDVRRFTQEPTFEDDVTLAVVKIGPPPELPVLFGNDENRPGSSGGEA
jgi:sigma-B regulation protein RsbU (phosphoserine phosphatase)